MAEDEAKPKKCPAGAPLWMCTFADMMSLLLCFFVILLSFSNMDEPSFVKMSGAMKEAFGSQRKTKVFEPEGGEKMLAPTMDTVPFDPRDEVEKAVEEFTSAGMVDVAEVQDGLLVRIKDSLAFDSGRAEIKPQFAALLDKIGRIIAASDSQVVVNGHTDDVPLQKESGFRNNWELSAARAAVVIEYWQKKFAIPSSRLAATGHADGRPIIGNSTEEGRARNRRVEFVIKPGKGGAAFPGMSELQ